MVPEVLKGKLQAALNPNPGPGSGISDGTRGYVMDYHWEIQDADGRAIGTINAIGFGGGSPPPGSALEAFAGNFTVVV